MRRPSNPWRTLGVTVAVIVGGLLLVGCSTNGQVRALHADPMGAWSAPGMSAVGGHDSKPGTTLGKPQYARVLRILSVPSGETAGDAVLQARRAALRSGWSVEHERDGSFSAEKAFVVGGEEFRGELMVGPQAVGPDRHRAREIYVSLALYPA